MCVELFAHVYKNKSFFKPFQFLSFFCVCMICVAINFNGLLDSHCTLWGLLN